MSGFFKQFCELLFYIFHVQLITCRNFWLVYSPQVVQLQIVNTEVISVQKTFGFGLKSLQLKVGLKSKILCINFVNAKINVCTSTNVH